MHETRTFSSEERRKKIEHKLETLQSPHEYCQKNILKGSELRRIREDVPATQEREIASPNKVEIKNLSDLLLHGGTRERELKRNGTVSINSSQNPASAFGCRRLNRANESRGKGGGVEKAYKKESWE